MADNSFHPDNRLIDAMLSHVAEQGWRGLTVADVAARADIPVETAEALCPNRTDLLDMFACRVDATSIVDVGPVPDDPDARYDQLLDIMMQRFEVLEPDKVAVSRLTRDVACEPDTLLRILPQCRRSFAGLAAAAGYPGSGLGGLLFAKALALVWLATQRVWLQDTGADLGETMAALDRNLRRAMAGLAALPACAGLQISDPPGS